MVARFEDIERSLASRGETLRGYGVRELFVFGSFARGQARSDSDRVLWDAVRNKLPGFLVRVCELLEAADSGRWPQYSAGKRFSCAAVKTGPYLQT